MNITQSLCRIAATCASAMLLSTAARADIQPLRLEVVAGNHTDTYMLDYVMPFLEKQLPERSGGKVTARAVPFTELGLGGFELMNMLKIGAYDMAYSVLGYIEGDSPIAGGLELPGVVGSLDGTFKGLAAYRPILEREYAAKFNARPMLANVLPHSQLYCKLTGDELKNFSLATLKGKKTRVHATSAADFVEGLGMVPVTMPFPDVVPALERGAIDCGLAAPNAAYGFKFGQVANTVVDIVLFHTIQFLPINLDTWNGLNADTRAFLTEQFNDLEARMAQYAPTYNKTAVDCLLDGPCTLGEPARMTLATLNAADRATLKNVVENVVLARWVKRCGKGCAQEWNAALGDITGITLAAD